MKLGGPQSVFAHDVGVKTSWELILFLFSVDGTSRSREKKKMRGTLSFFSPARRMLHPVIRVASVNEMLSQRVHGSCHPQAQVSSSFHDGDEHPSRIYNPMVTIEIIGHLKHEGNTMEQFMPQKTRGA